MKREFFALSVVLALLVAFPAALFGYQAWRMRAAGVRVIDVVARVPEQGGFLPDRLTLAAGEPVRLRLSSPDVVHGLVIPELGVDVPEIMPGQVVEVDVTPERPGRYAFACTRWCGVDHWRMRGVIEVSGGGVAEPAAVGADMPLFQKLGLDIDAMRHSTGPVPEVRPSADRGAVLGLPLPDNLADPARRRSVVPQDAFAQLRADPALAGLGDGEVWDLVAWAWLRDPTPQSAARAAELYVRDCAACHGPDGRGDGPAGKELPGLTVMDPAMRAGPADFTDAASMLSASDALLQGKLLRGGMGTGMPEFGSLYTDEELWALIAYVRGFVFAASHAAPGPAATP